MAQIPTIVGDNPSWPYQYSETYVPDQLIAGDAKLVTEGRAQVGGGVPLVRGTVMGLSSVGTVSASTGKTFASGTITGLNLPVAGGTLTLGGTVITFVTSNPVGNQVPIGGMGYDGFPPVNPTVAGTMQALTTFLAGSTDANLSKNTYSLNGLVLTVQSATLGTGGNAFTMAQSDTAFTLSGATLAGGTANSGSGAISAITPGPNMKAGNYMVTATSATNANVVDPQGASLGAATVGTPFVSAEINFTLGGTPTAGDLYALRAAPGSGVYLPASPTATDGSQVPSAILADTIDVTAGPAICGLYLSGEFNIRAMTFPAGLTPAAAKAALRPLAIWLKDSVSAADPA